MPASQSTVFDPPKAEQGWTRLEAPELFKFEKRGDEVTGKLLNISKIEIESQDRPGEMQSVTQYLIARYDDSPVKLLGTYDLNQKLGSRRYVGCLVRIVFLGEDQKIKRGNNYMKVFAVDIKGTPNEPTNGNSGPITDDDIPF